MIVFASEYVPRKATTIRFAKGAWESAIYPQESASKGPVFQV